MFQPRWFLAVLLLCGGGPACAEEGRYTGPWDMAALRQPPTVTWGAAQGQVRPLYFESEPYNGQPTQVFAYYAQPAVFQGRLPAVVLVHGGQGKAYPEWALMWAARGYAALALDLRGNGPDGRRLADGGPELDSQNLFFVGTRQAWPYHGVAATVRAVSLLRSLPQVDGDRIGVTGISWGGVVTCLVAGIDDRIRAAAPVYGCGFVYEDGAFIGAFLTMDAWQRLAWATTFDPSSYLGQARAPMLFVTGTNDGAFALGTWQKSARLAPGHQLCAVPGLAHGQAAGSSVPTVGLFMDQHLKRGEPIPLFLGQGQTVHKGNVTVVAQFLAAAPVARAELYWTTTKGPWMNKKWAGQAARVGPGWVRAELPPQRPLAYFLSVTDQRGATVSTEHVILLK
jgi:dienelactone hydrolase